MISHPRGPGKPCRHSVTRTNAKSQTIGPLLPSFTVPRTQAVFGSRVSNASTRYERLLGVLRRCLVGFRPLPDHGGMITAGWRRQICVEQAISVKYHNPRSAMASRKAGLSPYSASAATQRADRTL